MPTLLVPLLLACQPPPPAPEELDPLVAFLFEHHLDEDPRALEEGLIGLRDWFETSYDADEDASFELLTPLSAEAVGALDASVAYTHPDTKSPRASAGMGGAAAGTVSDFSVADATRALTALDQDEVFPDTFEEWGRTWRLCDGVAFATRGCDLAESDEQQLSVFGLGLQSEGEAYNQYRWVDLADGTVAMQHRNWQIYPPTVNSDLLEVADQYYLNTFVERVGGGAFRFQATWAVFGDDVPRELALKLTSSSMFDSSQELDAWLAAEGADR